MTSDKQLPSIVKTGALMPAVSQSELVANLSALQALVKTQFVDGEHCGTIPGSDKKSLFKPGAELLLEFYQLYPVLRFIDKVEDWDRVPELFDYTIETTLMRRSDDSIVAVGVGSCNSYESKYKYRNSTGGRKCPECNKEGSIKRSGFPNKSGPYKDEKGWYCHDKAGGCGSQFANSKDPAIINQKVESVREFNPDIASCKNTVLKMAKKRSLVDACLGATRSSNLFTQDVEDFEDTWDVRDVDIEVQETRRPFDREVNVRVREKEEARKSEPVDAEVMPQSNREKVAAMREQDRQEKIDRAQAQRDVASERGLDNTAADAQKKLDELKGISSDQGVHLTKVAQKNGWTDLKVVVGHIVRICKVPTDQRALWRKYVTEEKHAELLELFGKPPVSEESSRGDVVEGEEVTE